MTETREDMQKLVEAVTCGWCVMVQLDDGTWQSLDFGLPREPDPELLMRRDRVGLFRDAVEARKALEKSSRGWHEEGLDWFKGRCFAIKPILHRRFEW